jgi:hypothetical protein
MSLKNTIFLTDENEHWYRDGEDDIYVLNFDREHEVVHDKDGNTTIFIREHTKLGQKIAKLTGWSK